MRRLLIRKYIEPLKAAFDTRVTTDGGTNEANDTQIDSWINPWKSKILTLPNAFKAGVLYSIYGDDWDVVRAGATATRVKSDGEIQTGIAANVPRLDYLNGEPVVLVEPERENVILNSQDPTQSSWAITNYTPSTGDVILGVTSTRLTKNATNNGGFNGTGARNIVQVVGDRSPSAEKTISFIIKKGNTDRLGCLLLNFNSGVANPSFRFVFATNSFVTVSSGLSTSYKEIGLDEYLIECTLTDSSTATNKQVWISPIDSSNQTDDGFFLDFLFLQIEEGGTATSYIPTTGSTVTRNADVIDVNVPAGTTSIAVTFEDGSTVVENSPGATYQLPEGRIKSVIFNP